MATTLTPPLLSPSRPRRPGVLYPRAQWYFFVAMLLTWLGFSHTYFAVVRSEPLLHHVHGALMGGWIAILMLQPVLYQRGKLQLHRTLGRWAVYLWVPAMLLCGFFMDRRMLRTHSVPASVLDQLAFLDIASLLLFAGLIVLSILYAGDLGLHARFIVCTVLLLLPPALARALFIVPGMHTFRVNGNVACGLVILVALLLMIDDRRHGPIRAPYPLFALVFGALTVVSNFVRPWAWWHAVASRIAGT